MSVGTFLAALTERFCRSLASRLVTSAGLTSLSSLRLQVSYWCRPGRRIWRAAERAFDYHLLEQHQLTERIFAEIRSLLEEKRLLLKSGTIVDATIIAAPPSTKNEQKARDPEMHQTRKGKD